MRLRSKAAINFLIRLLRNLSVDAAEVDGLVVSPSMSSISLLEPAHFFFFRLSSIHKNCTKVDLNFSAPIAILEFKP